MGRYSITKSTEDSVNHIVQQLGEIKNQVCVSEESLISHMHDASRQDSQSQTESNERTFAEVTVNNVDLQTLQRLQLKKSQQRQGIRLSP